TSTAEIWLTNGREGHEPAWFGRNRKLQHVGQVGLKGLAQDARLAVLEPKANQITPRVTGRNGTRKPISGVYPDPIRFFRRNFWDIRDKKTR
ncbi:hypothetical protein KI387_040907, partial [Taxus chinensis]